MGKSPGSSQKKKLKQKDAIGAGSKAPSAAQLYQQAQLALQYDDFDGAKACLKRAAKQEPGNIEIVDALGALLAELGPQKEAILVLRHAVALSPDVGFEKYMYLGQLLEGSEAVQAVSIGVSVLEEAVKAAAAADATKAAAASSSNSHGTATMDVAGSNGSPSMASRVLRVQLCAALCSLAEMKLCEADEVAAVSEEVEALLQRALAADATSPEPLQALASLRYEQGRSDEALVFLHRSMALWFPGFKDPGQEDEESDEDEEGTAGRAGRGASGMEADNIGAAVEANSSGGQSAAPDKPASVAVTTPAADEDAAMAEENGQGDDMDEQGASEADEEDEESEEEEDDGMPSYEFRFECAKLLLELEDATDNTIHVLESLIEEDDSNPDVWHLLALAYYSGHAFSEAQEVLDKGKELLIKLGIQPGDDEAGLFDELQVAISEAVQAGEGA